MEKILISVLTAIIGIFSIAFAFAQPMMYSSGEMMQGYYGGYGYNSGIILLDWITSLLIIALLGAAIYWLIKSANKK